MAVNVRRPDGRFALVLATTSRHTHRSCREERYKRQLLEAFGCYPAPFLLPTSRPFQEKTCGRLSSVSAVAGRNACIGAPGVTNESYPQMGMDVYGRNPSGKEGEYFRNNVWWWRPLADICQSLAPKICANCKHWQSNDGDGLDAADAAALASVLETRIDDGTLDKLIAERDAYIEALPDEPCSLCEGAGRRSDELAIEHGWDKKPCNACKGSGTQRPFETHYPQDVENVREFATFLKASGGFRIC